jgi:hypothetical protein
MDIIWHVTADDKACVKAFIDEQRNTPLVCDRYDRNLAESKCKVTEERFWRAMVCMRLTTQAPSGPNSKVSKFQSLSPFPFTCDVIRNTQSRQEFILNTLNTHHAGRRRPTISKDLANNFQILEDGEWKHVINQCNRLIHLERRETEAEVADYIVDKFKGFGPKQSRNVLQVLGLTRYEIPIDSRVTKWLNKQLKFPLYVTPNALSDKHCYNFILDAICKLCEECKIFPCVLDASIFGANRGDAWSMK